MTRYAILDTYGRVSLAIVEADAPLGALDAYCELEGVTPYSASLEALDPAEADGLTYTLFEPAGSPFDGLLGAVFANYEILAYPIAEGELEAVGPGQAGYAVRDAVGTYVADALAPDDAARLVEGGTWRYDVVSS